MSKKEYIEQIKPLREIIICNGGVINDMYGEEEIEEKYRHNINHMQEYLIKTLCVDKIFEVYIVIKKDLSFIFLANATYPYHHMWNGYGPWTSYAPTKLTRIEEIGSLEFI